MARSRLIAVVETPTAPDFRRVADYLMVGGGDIQAVAQRRR